MILPVKQNSPTLAGGAGSLIIVNLFLFGELGSVLG